MPNSDPYLRDGLTPNTDIELYESAALGGYTKAGTAIAQGVASGTQDLTYSETGQAVAQGAASGSKTVTANRTGAGIANGVATGVDSRTVDRAGSGIAEGAASGAKTVTSDAETADTPVGGNLRRHLGKSTGKNHQDRQKVRFRFTVTVTVKAQVVATRTRIVPPHTSHRGAVVTAAAVSLPTSRISSHLCATTRLATPKSAARGHLSASCRVIPPLLPVSVRAVPVGFIDDEDELLLLDLL